MSLPGILTPEPARRQSKLLKYLIGILAVALVLGGLYWFFFRFHSQESTVDRFMNQVIAGQFQNAYKMWQRESTYSYSDFLQDWGTKGYYGPVRSFRIVTVHEPSDASGVIVVVDISPFSPFPSQGDFEKTRYTKEARLWVQFSDDTISYAPQFP